MLPSKWWKMGRGPNSDFRERNIASMSVRSAPIASVTGGVILD